MEQAKKIEDETLWDCHEHDDLSDKQHIEECLSEMLAEYIGDERNYVVDGAEIECTEMCIISHCIKYENGKTKLYNVLNAPKGIERDYVPPGKEEGKAFYFGSDTDTDKVRRLFTLHAKGASDNGIRFGTVVDRKCLRDVREGVVDPVTPDDGIPAACEANIISCGNCRIMRVSDIAEIEKRWDESMEYGTCYSLIKPVAEWLNPLCAESVAGNCDAENNLALNMGLIEVGPTKPSCVITEHHKVLEFDTQYGKKEGLTMLSTLLCTRGGVITIKVHGQIYLDANMMLVTNELFITIDQLLLLGWNNITQESVDELNRVLVKYEINSVERIRHFLAQCMKETGRGACLREREYIKWSSQAEYEDFFNKNTAYGYKYRGAGYLQLTWDYAYLAFATYMIKQECSDLSIEWRSPKNTGTGFQERYDAAVQKAEEIQAVGGNIIMAMPHMAMPRAANVAMLGWDLLQNGKADDVMSLEPLYIRRSEAEVLWEKRNGVKE